jgi:hypothetical protein
MAEARSFSAQFGKTQESYPLPNLIAQRNTAGLADFCLKIHNTYTD